MRADERTRPSRVACEAAIERQIQSRAPRGHGFLERRAALQAGAISCAVDGCAPRVDRRVRPRCVRVSPYPAPRPRHAGRLDALVLVPHLRHTLLLALAVDFGIVVLHLGHLLSLWSRSLCESSPAKQEVIRTTSEKFAC